MRSMILANNSFPLMIMAPEHQSFVGVGDEVYPVGDLEGARPAGSGIHGEVLPPMWKHV